MSKYKATVFIPTWFGEEYLEELLTSVLNQKVPFEFEILVYDTSSADRTPAILAEFKAKHKNIRLKTITKEEFGHGRTRQAAALDSDAEFMVYLSQDATPAHDRWLYEMTKPFEINEKVVAVLGKQEPRAHAIPLLKNEIRAVFGGLGAPVGVTLYQKTETTGEVLIDFMGFYSDVNSAARRSVLTGEIPYRDVPYSEDQLFGRDVIKAGYIKAYAPQGMVIHSNDISLREYKHRMFDETVGLRKVGIPVDTPSLKTVAKVTVRGVLKDFLAILRDPQYSFKRKLYWIVMNPMFHIEKWRGVRLGSTVNLEDKDMYKQNSLEEKRQGKKQT